VKQRKRLSIEKVLKREGRAFSKKKRGRMGKKKKEGRSPNRLPAMQGGKGRHYQLPLRGRIRKRKKEESSSVVLYAKRGSYLPCSKNALSRPLRGGGTKRKGKERGVDSHGKEKLHGVKKHEKKGKTRESMIASKKVGSYGSLQGKK